MDKKINIASFEKKIDEKTGAVLFYQKDFRGVPDKVLSGDGWTLEFNNNEVVMIDIYKPDLFMEYILEKASMESIDN
jgi:hypothetical protein